MSGRYIVPLDLGDSVVDKSLHYLRRFVGEKESGKNVVSYIGGAKKKIVVVCPRSSALDYGNLISLRCLLKLEMPIEKCNEL
jgi:hypothetical protein